MKRIIKQCTTKRVTLLLMSLLLSLVMPLSIISSSVSASSIFDNTYKTSEELHVGLSCEENFGPYYTTLMSKAQDQSMKDSFFDAQHNGGTIAVTQIDTGTGYPNDANHTDHSKRIGIAWSSTPNKKLSWLSDNDWPFKRVILTGMNYAIFNVVNEGNDPLSCNVRYDTVQYTQGGNFTVSNENTDYTVTGIVSNYFFTGDPNYPAGYAGQQVVATPKPKKPVIKPDIQYTVNDKDVSAKDYKADLPEVKPKDGYTVKGYSVEWNLFSCSNVNEQSGVCTGDSKLVQGSYKIQPQDDNYNFTVTDHGNYIIQTQYLVEECYRYPSYPATPDHCFYIDLETELPDYAFTSTSVYLKIDGSTFGGDTKDLQCDDSGFCKPKSLYEDCSTYGMNIIGVIGCHYRNFQKWLVLTIKSLFIPQSDYLQKLINKTRNNLSDHLGVLVYPFAYLSGIINAFQTAYNAQSTPCANISVNNTSYTLNTGGKLFGGSFNPNFCDLPNKLPQIWNVTTIIIRIITLFAIIVGWYRMFFHTIVPGSYSPGDESR